MIWWQMNYCLLPQNVKGQLLDLMWGLDFLFQIEHDTAKMHINVNFSVT